MDARQAYLARLATKGTKAATRETHNGQDMLIGWLLQDIKALWDQEGFGSDDAVSEPLYARLNAAITLLQKGE